MFIVALLGAFIFYIGLYLLWESTKVPMNSVDAVLRTLNQMMWLPQNTVFLIFRGVLLIGVLYVVGDLILSAAKRATRRRETEEKNVLSWKKPPRV